jgi:predicted lysophospholipase L1 biosynthesis ABC-type transport system permease subunit
MALVLSGVRPAIGVITSAVQRRRLDIIRAVELAGIVVGSVLGLVSHNARLVLLEGSVPTAVFELARPFWASARLLLLAGLSLVPEDLQIGGRPGAVCGRVLVDPESRAYARN